MATQIQFFPLDATYKIVDGKAIINLFGKTDDGKQITVLDADFEPYFYVISVPGTDLEEKIKKIRVEDEKGLAFVTKTEALIKKYLGKEIAAIKVFTNLPSSVPQIRSIIKEWDSVSSTHEYDIPYVRKYFIDKKITPMVQTKAMGNFISQKSRSLVFKAEKIEQTNSDTLNEPKILAVDIETYSPFGTEINPSKNPILMIALHGKEYKKVFVWKKFRTQKQFIEFVDSEAKLIEKFKEAIDNFKPDILTGYFSDGFDLPYIKTRAEKYKIKLDIGFDFSEFKTKTGRDTSVSINGIVHLDIFKFIKKVMGSTMDTYTFDLSSVANELLNEKKREVSLEELPNAWDKHNDKLEKYCEYNLHDTYLTYNLAVKMMPTIIEMVKIIGIPIFDVNRMGFSQLVEWYIMGQALSFNEIAPNKPHYDELQQRRNLRYQGAFVFEPKPGFHKDIVVFDFRSLYPTIIGSHNIGLDTLNCTCCKETSNKIEDAGQTFWYCEKKKGFIPILIEDIITRRMRIKEIVKKESSEKLKFLDARQMSLKLLANSFYGYLGFFGARWYSFDCARSVTAWGRSYIHKVINRAKEKGFAVLYSDTDSVFLKLDGKSKQDSVDFADSINKELPGLMELEYEGYYPSGIFVSAKAGPFGAKKKYALLAENGQVKIKGFETVRRNWSIIAKDVQEKVLNIVLKEHDDKKALNYVREVIDELKNKKIPKEKVIISTQLQKDIVDYTSKGPHVAAAQRMQNQGKHVGPGSIINYIVAKGGAIIRDKVKLPDEVTDKDYDSDYYINNQVIPAVDKIFEVLGYSPETLLETKDQTKLGGFF
jgi:DNA polymerase, archaea type